MSKRRPAAPRPDNCWFAWFNLALDKMPFLFPSGLGPAYDIWDPGGLQRQHEPERKRTALGIRATVQTMGGSLTMRCRRPQYLSSMLLFAVLPSGGCQPSSSSAPESHKPGPEEVRAALIELVEGDLENELAMVMPEDTAQQVAQYLKSKKKLDNLKNLPFRRNYDRVTIGDWSCELDKLTYSIEVERSQVRFALLLGTFRLDPNQRWKAVPRGIARGSFPAEFSKKSRGPKSADWIPR